jgi:alkylation response protein AidB-like acyl-CoA dehydrogenase
MGELAGRVLYRMQLDDRLNEPVLTQWDAWGNRIDRIEHTALWKRAEQIAAEKGLVATAYERNHGRHSRIHQFALVYLFTPSTDVFSCPLAMTDGAAYTLVKSRNQKLIDRALPHLTSRDPSKFWTSGQWMTEFAGGSDVGLSETEAKKDESGQWRLYGRKWFTSAAAAPMALTLGRPEGNGPGGQGLAMYYVETRDHDGKLQGIEVCRLKDKLGTRKLPTAEIFLHGTPAELVQGAKDGVKHIAPMLNITRTWNAITAASFMRRAIALVEDFARKRFVFGGMLSEKPLHQETISWMKAESEAAFLLAFYVVELLGRDEAGEMNEDQAVLFRLLTSVTKATTGKQAVKVVSEAVECFGGAGYCEDTGLAGLLRDTQVLSIWEGTTNVLSLDALRTVVKENALVPFHAELDRLIASPGTQNLGAAIDRVRAMKDAQTQWYQSNRGSQEALEAGARKFALSIGHSLQLALLVHHGRPSALIFAGGE